MKRIMALVAATRKFLLIIYAIVGDDSEYGVDYVLKRKVIKKLGKVSLHRRGDHRFLPLRCSLRPSTSEYMPSRSHPNSN
jgi:hypothetical protein